MSARDPRTRVIVGKLAAERRHHPERDSIDLRRELAAARLEDHIRRIVATAPPLTEEQAARLRALLPPRTHAIGGPDAA